MKKLIPICLVVLFVANVHPVQATIMGVALGTGAPPSALGPYTMTAFGPDPRPSGPYSPPVTSVDSPLGGTVNFNSPMTHYTVGGSSWSTWSHGYTGDVYSRGLHAVVVLTLPSDTAAFYFYAEPQSYYHYTITATSQDGTLVSQYVYGNSGACGYGFWADGGDLISTINVACDGDNFAVGEFGIAVPEPATVCLLSLGALSLIRRKK